MPPGYSGAYCDVTGKGSLQNDPDGFYHCPICRWDAANSAALDGKLTKAPKSICFKVEPKMFESNTYDIRRMDFRGGSKLARMPPHMIEARIKLLLEYSNVFD